MRKSLYVLSLIALMCSTLWVMPLDAQERSGWVTGSVADAAGGILPGARVELQPQGSSVVTNGQGQFTISGVAPGQYKLSVNYVGFAPFSTDVTVAAGQTARVDAVLQVGVQTEVLTVRGDRQRGEVEAINIEMTADNIVQVLPNEVITSLPNTNIADAVGRLPSVSLERDEGEGKYIQIRGTEPRLSNVTVNGIHLPSPEGVRNVKLDAIPADLIDMVEINKTLSANQDADAIGGSVNLVTKSPADKPYVTVLGMGGYTPISGGRSLYQFDGTAGQRFGTDKKFGLLFGGSYDYNARGIDDLEPGPGVNTLPDGSTFLGPSTEDQRNYHYDRSRYGFDGEADYKLGDMSSVYLRGLFSKFKDYGEDWIYTPGISTFVADPSTCTPGTPATAFSGPTGCGSMGFTDVFRTPGQQLFSVQAGARHAVKTTLITYELALSQAHYTGGFDFGGFGGPGSASSGPNSNNVAFGVDTRDPFVPKFPVLNGINIHDPAQYHMTFADAEKDSIFERDVVGDISLNKQYSIASHYSSFEIGFKGWDAAKTSRFDRENFNAAGGQPMTQFLSSFRDNNYYFGNFTYGPVTDYNKILAAVQGGGTTPNIPYNLRNSFNIGERIWAGYAMDTISFGRLRLQAGVRVESTQDALRAVTVTMDPVTSQFIVTPVSTNKSYINPFPSVQAQYRFGSDTILRAAYGMGIARPNFGDSAPYFAEDPTSFPRFRAGNPNLKPTHGQNFDLLLEHYLKPLGLIQAGVFYKALTDPIFTLLVPFGGAKEDILVNGPNAHITGFEAAWQQRLSFLPGVLNGMGVRANYSYTTSRATFPQSAPVPNYVPRTDHPTLLRTAPNNWNLDVTYDKKGFSARMGLTHNDANLWFYGGSNSKDPNGDTYLYPHTQVDAQVSYWIPGGHGLQAIVSMLNLNNEVFGFYQGAERYPIQREYYSRTISAGLRWTLPTESR
jgi:TonB-dependent receptor